MKIAVAQGTLVVAAWLACSACEASHDWVGLDLCRTYPERMPPELDARILPDPESDGARLLGRYCSQCHFAPGPGQHTASEWAALVPRMDLLMEVTARFGDGSRPIARPGTDEQAALLAYLQRHALFPLAAIGEAPPAYRALCGDCHAAPDPTAYAGADWPALLARMDGHRVTMRRASVDQVARAQVAAYLGLSGVLAPDSASTAQAGRAMGLTDDDGRWLALGPILLLTLVGLARWWLGQRGRP